MAEKREPNREYNLSQTERRIDRVRPYDSSCGKLIRIGRIEDIFDETKNKVISTYGKQCHKRHHCIYSSYTTRTKKGYDSGRGTESK